MSDDERMTEGERVGDSDRASDARAVGDRAAGERVTGEQAGSEQVPSEQMAGEEAGEGERDTVSEPMTAGTPAADPWKRDRGARRRPTEGAAGESAPGRQRAKRRGLGATLGGIVWEVVGELVFFGLVVLVSWLVYEEVRWAFVAVVFLSVNAVLVAIALAVWLRVRRQSRRSR